MNGLHQHGMSIELAAKVGHPLFADRFRIEHVTTQIEQPGDRCNAVPIHP